MAFTHAYGDGYDENPLIDWIVDRVVASQQPDVTPGSPEYELGCWTRAHADEGSLTDREKAAIVLRLNDKLY